MNITEKINEDLKAAMKAKDQVALRGIRAVKAALLLANTDGSGAEMTEEKFITIVQKLIKQRQDSLDIYKKQNRPDLAKVEEEEIEAISKYLPEQMGSEELEKFLSDLVSELGAEGMKDMGRVMGEASKRLAGKADGKTISGIVRNLFKIKLKVDHPGTWMVDFLPDFYYNSLSQQFYLQKTLSLIFKRYDFGFKPSA